MQRMVQRGATPGSGVGFARRMQSTRLPAKILTRTSRSLTSTGSISRTCANMPSRSRKAVTWSVWLQHLLPRQVRLDLSAGWIFRSFVLLPAAMCRAPNMQNPDIEVIQNMTGTTPAAWNDPAKGTELTQSQIDRGADVIYQAAGGTGIGVIRAASGRWKIFNWRGLKPELSGSWFCSDLHVEACGCCGLPNHERWDVRQL